MRWPVALATVADSFGAIAVMTAAPAKPRPTPGRAADDAHGYRFAHDLGDDPPRPPAERLKRAELPHPPGHRRHRQQARHRERRDEYQDGQPPAEVVGQLGGTGQRPGHLAG